MDIRTALPAPRPELQTVDPSQRSVFLEEFIVGEAFKVSSTAGSGTANEAVQAVANSTNGEATIKSASDDGTHAANASTISLTETNFRADKGGLAMEARIKIDDITTVALFVGFSDTVSTTVELPIFKTEGADTIDSDAANACGVAFDTDGTTDQWFQGGVKADADTAATHSGTAPANNTYVTIRVEVSTAGAVQGFINGTAIGTATANAVTATTSLTPFIVVANRAAAQRTMTIDYIWASQKR